MSRFQYSQIEQQIVEVLPEIGPSAEFYWQTEGAPGQDCGPYIFFEQLFAAYIEVLLWLPPTPRRDELLRRAFTVAEQMFESVEAASRRALSTLGLFNSP